MAHSLFVLQPLSVCNCLAATWNDATVAVKVICGLGGNKAAGLHAKREASLSSDLRHPNIVHTFFQSTRSVPIVESPTLEVRKSVADLEGGLYCGSFEILRLEFPVLWYSA